MKPLMADICRIVGEHYGYTRTEIESQRRQRPLVRCRHVAIYLCCMLVNHSYPRIGRHFHRNHTSVIWGEERIKIARRFEPKLAEELDYLEAKIRAEYEGADNENKETVLQVLGG